MAFTTQEVVRMLEEDTSPVDNSDDDLGFEFEDTEAVEYGNYL